MVNVTAALAAHDRPMDRKGKRRADPDSDTSDEDALASSRKLLRLKDGAAVVSSVASLKKIKGAGKGGGSFQSMGLLPNLLRSLLLRGFTVPTPIQRVALPAILASPPRDLVGMARTGSGKTLAYMLPLLQRLGLAHSATFGARALILVPTRELALQVLLVGKDLARGAKQGGDNEVLRWGMIVGGDSLEEQFSLVASNPDVIIATPGRLLHLAVEMKLELKAVEYVVFDEADRLFELGFATQLHEILSRLPTSRQTLLFSATLPRSLVEFAKAGLQNPKLVRLDSESKISSDLRMAFLSVKPSEKEAALLCLLRDVIRVPFGSRSSDDTAVTARGSKRKRSAESAADELGPHQTLIFAATKHHVEYLSAIMTAAGYAVSAIYGSLDHAARKSQLLAFRSGRTQLLCVTDLAARGIDIPILENVINYDFPVGARTFVHRVGRTARAGRKGWAYSFLTAAELPHLLDLQLFLSRPLVQWDASLAVEEVDFSGSLVLGSVPREALDEEVEHCRSVIIEPSPTVIALQGVAERGQRMYERSSAKASAESHRRAKHLIAAPLAVHPVFANAPEASATSNVQVLLDKIKAFRPIETVFEIGSRGKAAGAQLMQNRRRAMQKAEAAAVSKTTAAADTPVALEDQDADVGHIDTQADMEMAQEEELRETFEVPEQAQTQAARRGFRDSETYLDYAQPGAAAERGYSLNDGAASFASQAARVSSSMPLVGHADGDDAEMAPQRASALRWDRRTKRIVRGDGTGSDNKKLIRTEAGTRLPASFSSGRYDAWKTKQRVHLPKIGDSELPRAKNFAPRSGPRYRHHAGPSGDADGEGRVRGRRNGKTTSRPSQQQQQHRGKRPGRGASHLRNIDEIAKQRRLKEKRTWRSSGPGKKAKGRRK